MNANPGAVIARPSALRAAGVLGINGRNARYTLRWNPRHLYPRVDDKLLTKKLCEAAGVPVPRTLATVHYHSQLRELARAIEPFESFVLKPVHGAMGKGILVILSRDGDRLRRPDGREIRLQDFVFHASGIVSGLYALAGQPDVAMVEERLEVHPLLRAIAVEGVPDVRIVIYRGVPVMAMTRLPTHRSGGRANLHQGAIGAGIDLRSGRLVHAALGASFVTHHPESGGEIVGATVPEFDRALEIALIAADQTGLGYLGADVVIDATRGPVVLELNARPGLSIQLANGTGLLPRLEAVDRELGPGGSLEARLALGRRIASGGPER